MEDSRAIRQAAAELVAGMLEPQGRRFIAQVSPQPRAAHNKPNVCCCELRQGFATGSNIKQEHAQTHVGAEIFPRIAYTTLRSHF